MKVTDPVCGMQFDAAKAAAKLEYEGVTYWFCTDACKRRFEQDPSQYVRTS
jgi:Cu+-exporting ATPase